MSAIESESPPVSAGRPDPDIVASRRAGIRVRGAYIPYVLILPALVAMVGVLGYPLVKVVILAFQNVNSYVTFTNPDLVRWIGIQGFQKVLSDPQFWEVVRRSLFFTVEVVFLSIALGLLFATLLNRVSPWAKVLVVTVLMFVWSIPAIVTGTIFRWMFAGTSGVIDYICYRLGGKGMQNHDWFANPTQGLYVVVALVVVWGALPFLVIGLNAAMTQVPKELVEASRLDGANVWQSFWYVVLPVIRPFLMLSISLSFIWDFQVFAQIWSLRQSSPEPGYWTIGIYLYEKGIVSSHYSSSGVISIAMILLMLAVMVFYIRQIIKIGAQD
ncbi:carbohydrate ABC transporter permease [Streptacidiphilus sp. PAMC 29251]